MRDTYILHDNDLDGFGAAYSAWKLYKDQAKYIPLTHGKPLPDMPNDANVFILDFSYPRDVLEELNGRMNQLRVIDHHVTAQKELEGLDYCDFDMKHSGAYLAWEFFQGLSSHVPWLIRYVEDFDLFRFELPQSKEVVAALESEPMDFGIWDNLARGEKSGIARLAQDGVPIVRYRNQMVEKICSEAGVGNVCGYQVPICNANLFSSYVGNKLVEDNPWAPFVALYRDKNDGTRSWSLYSIGEFDTSEVSRSMGGGGHKNASGFTESIPRQAPMKPDNVGDPVPAEVSILQRALELAVQDYTRSEDPKRNEGWINDYLNKAKKELEDGE
ncbi:MAG: phosphoesterase [Candidatus Omnitrophica bacterium]|nr:phosphoesterase [Candidatus Omnitrophota bacterium]